MLTRPNPIYGVPDIVNQSNEGSKLLHITSLDTPKYARLNLTFLRQKQYMSVPQTLWSHTIKNQLSYSLLIL